MTPASLTQLSDSLKSLYIKTAQKLKGSDRRQFMAEVVKGFGLGGQSLMTHGSLIFLEVRKIEIFILTVTHNLKQERLIIL